MVLFHAKRIHGCIENSKGRLKYAFLSKKNDVYSIKLIEN